MYKLDKNIKNKTEFNRESFLDLIKVIAVLFIMCTHGINIYSFVNDVYLFYLDNILFYITFILNNVFITSVPLFFMITGYLNFKNKNYEKKYSKLILLMITYICIGFITWYVRYSFGDYISFKKFIYLLLSFKIIDYAWFFETYIGLFMLLWPLNKLYKSLDSKENKFKFIMILLLVIQVPIIISLIQKILFGYQEYTGYWISLYPILYYYVGSYIAEYNITFKFNKKNLLLVLFALFPILLIIDLALVNKMDIRIINNSFYSIGIFSLSILIFILIKKIKIKNLKISNILRHLSKYSFSMILFSYCFDLILRKIYGYNIIVGVVLNFIMSYLCSLILGYILNFIIKGILFIVKKIKYKNNKCKK